MRLILGITLVLFGTGLLACQVADEPRAARPAAESWVRTAQGWEKPSAWEAPAGPSRLHPLVVASGQLLVSMLGLAAARRDFKTAG
jgi:hypothetical protein